MTTVNLDLDKQLEIISVEGSVLAYIIKSTYQPKNTKFLTPPDYKRQVGYISYPQGGEIQRHCHKPLERKIVGTSEVLIIKKGLCELDIYDDEKNLVATRKLSKGDIMLMVSGGHGFRMLEDTVFIEVKQGPYVGLDEKERF